MKSLFPLLLVVVSIMIFSWAHKQPANAAVGHITGLHKAITQQEEWLNTSRKLNAEDLKGRIILLDFWTFCCINCIHVMPDLKYLEDTFGEKLTVIGVHSAKFLNERDTENIRQAVLRYNIQHPVVNDASFDIWRSFAVHAWPSFVLINPEGRIERTYSGEGNRNAIEKDIRRLIDRYGEQMNTEPLPIKLEDTASAPMLLDFPGKLAYADDIEGEPALFISDSGHHRILGIRLDGRIFRTIGSGKAGLKDGSLEEAQFNDPQGVLYRDGHLYVVETRNHTLRDIDLQAATVKTLAGSGEQSYDRRVKDEKARNTALASPWDLAFYPTPNHITMAMAGTHQLWVYDMKEKTVSILAGNGRESIDDGAYPLNSLSQPSGLAALGDSLYFVDSETSSLRVLKNGKITTLIGTGLFDFGYEEGGYGRGLLQHPLGVWAEEGTIYIADSYNHAIRRYDINTKQLHHFSGNTERGDNDGSIASSRYSEPNDIVRVGRHLYVADTNNHRIRVIDEESGNVSTLPLIPEAADVQISHPVDGLPNLIETSPLTLKADEALSIAIDLENGWKINDIAPSWLALFDVTGGDNPAPIAQWNTAQLKGLSLSSPTLEANRSYRLQGTLYFCEKKEGAICLVQSYDASLTSNSSNDSTDNITIRLRP